MSTMYELHGWSLRTRLAELIDQKTESEGKARFKYLEKITGIKTTHWRDFSSLKQRPTVEMIEAVCKLWPEHALWLTTGITDAEHGHIAPRKGNFPKDFQKLDTASSLFKKSIEALDAAIQAFNDDPDYRDPEMQLFALLNGHHRSAMQLKLPEKHAPRLNEAFSQVHALIEARRLEHEIKFQQPKEDYEITQHKIPERERRLRSAKMLSTQTIEDLEALMQKEQDLLARHKRIQERLQQALHGH